MNTQQKTEIAYLRSQGYGYIKIAQALGLSKNTVKSYCMQNNPAEAKAAAALDGVTTDRFFTPEQFQRDVDYYRAQSIAKSMLTSGLISLSQFDKLTALNRKFFSPFLVEIMPKSVDITADQR